jgi:arylsulfatase A-like enzyme/Tfp pilus assembly protein PilF
MNGGIMKKKVLIPMIGILVLIVIIFISLWIVKKDKAIKTAPEDYNLLVMTLDTLRADRVGVYGYEAALTPNLDALARGGVMFKYCYTPVPLTLPAHSSIFTGQYPLAHRVRDNGMYRLTDSAVTLAEKMKEKGFHTFAVIASFVLLSKFGLDQGFDIYDDSLNSHKMYNNYTSEIPASLVYTKFLQWFEKNYHKRFFAWVHLYDPHEPYRPPKKYAEKFKRDKSGRYNAEVAYTDECIGKIIEKLQAKDVLQKTVVVIMGDHGEAFGEHEEYGHGIFCYEEALNVPLIFFNQNLFPRGIRVTQRVNLVDVMPTILDVLGMEIPAAVQGKSFAHFLSGKSEKQRRGFYFESMHGKDEMNWAPLMGIIDGPYKYISLPEAELYNLETDREEKENLFWKKNQLAKEMDKKLMKWAAKYAKSGIDVEKDAKRELTGEDKNRLQSLGYISSFSAKSGAGANTDPKKGIILDNKIKQIFDTIGKDDTELAEKQLQDLISQSPKINLPIFYDLQHQIYVKKNDLEKTLGVLKEALEKFPKIERFYILYAFKLREKGQIQETETVCRKLLELNPRFTRAYILQGEIEEQKGNIDAAIPHYEKALTIEPQNMSLKLKYAELLIMKKSFQQALEIYDELLERKEVSGDANLLFKVGLFSAQFGNMEKAEKLLKKAVSLRPNGKFCFNYALVLSRNGKLGEALENMKIALNKYPSDLIERQIQMGQKAVALWQQQLQK